MLLPVMSKFCSVTVGPPGGTETGVWESGVTGGAALGCWTAGAMGRVDSTWPGVSGTGGFAGAAGTAAYPPFIGVLAASEIARTMLTRIDPLLALPICCFLSAHHPLCTRKTRVCVRLCNLTH